MITYATFLQAKIDLSSVGLDTRGEPMPYFCTPKGASILGSVGVDGIHFCTVPGFGETIFAVSPMNGVPDLVKPVAKSFHDFLCLLLSCGDTASIEQAWMWSEEQFTAFLAENTPTAEGRAVLGRLAETLHLTPMEGPYAYIHDLQAGFAYDKIPYTEEYYDTI